MKTIKKYHTYYKGLFFIFGIAMLFLHNYLFVKYAVAGSKTQDSEHVKEVNNHGSISWIKDEESKKLMYLQCIFCVSLASGFIVALVSRKWPDNEPDGE